MVVVKALHHAEVCDFGRTWPLVYIHRSAVVQFHTQLLFREYKRRNLWLSLEKGLLSSQPHVCG